MTWTSLSIVLSLLACAHCKYNPIPIGAVIVSTINYIYVMQPTEYGGTNELDIIYTAAANMSIVNTVYDPYRRDLYIMFTNSTDNGVIHISQLLSFEELSSTIYQLAINFNVSSINKLNSFTSDIINRRVFLTDSLGVARAFSMGGLMEADITTPATVTGTIRSVTYSNTLNKLFIITDSRVYACTNFDSGNLQCCQGQATSSQLRSIAIDYSATETFVYVLDEKSGVYRAAFDANGCPTALNPINTFNPYDNLHFVIDRGLSFVSGSTPNANDNSILLVANGTQTPRTYIIPRSIVALHVATPNVDSFATSQETCFHGITYGDYRVAVILAAIFGTLMGILVCFNTLFCIDFIMTKHIIRNLKKQIPHNLLEDRWNKLVEEKYAKIALEKERKKNDPPPKRLSSAAARNYTPAAGATTDATTTKQGAGDNESRTDSLQVPNPIPRLSAYLRRKSDSYVNRRRSDDYRNTRSQTRVEASDARSRTDRTLANVPQIHIGPVQEENETQQGLRQNLSRQQLLKDDDFL